MINHISLINKLLASIVISAAIASITIIVSFVGTSFADKVGPKGEEEDNVKQGAIGEFYSKEGRDYYADGQVGGATTSGQEYGKQRSTYAQPGDQEGGHESFGVQNNGANTAYYASGECHSGQPCE